LECGALPPLSFYGSLFLQQRHSAVLNQMIGPNHAATEVEKQTEKGKKAAAKHRTPKKAQSY
jgi:hypothetical protein